MYHTIIERLFKRIGIAQFKGETSTQLKCRTKCLPMSNRLKVYCYILSSFHRDIKTPNFTINEIYRKNQRKRRYHVCPQSLKHSVLCNCFLKRSFIVIIIVSKTLTRLLLLLFGSIISAKDASLFWFVFLIRTKPQYTS